LVARTGDPRQLLAELDNVFVAIERCTALASRESVPIAARLLLGLAALIDWSPLEPYLERLEAFLAAMASSAALSPDLSCSLQVTLGRCLRRLGRLADAKRLYAEALTLARANASAVHQAQLYAELGMVAFFENRIDDALGQWQLSMTISRQLGDDRRLGLDQMRCGMILRESNRLFEARSVLLDALATHRRAGDDDGLVITLAELAQIHLELDEIDECCTLIDEAARRPMARRSRLSEAAVLARRAFAHWERGEHEPGETLAQRALVHVAAIGYRRIQAGLVAYLAIARFLAGMTPRPREPLEWARQQLSSDPRGTHLFGAWLGHVVASDGNSLLAGELFASLPALAEGDPLAVTGAILRLPLEIADPLTRRERAAQLGDTILASTARAARASSFDVRLALRAVAAFAEPERTTPTRSGAASGGRALDIRADGSAFTLEGATQSLARHRTLRRLLLKLVDMRLAAPSTPLAWDQLFAAGWPTERAHVEAARNRVKVAISTLRSMGLRELILHDGMGYLLDPLVDVRVITS
jgi:tetratricopeptide (TPR) repeat protein